MSYHANLKSNMKKLQENLKLRSGHIDQVISTAEQLKNSSSC